ncbi:MAG: nicotinate (nicotinamide) nucleotide adenylyltransferase [Eubacteriales bacterium]
MNDNMQPRLDGVRLGIYGGTFSPPHIGHLRAALALCSLGDIDRVLVIPAAIPPHKRLCGEDEPRRRLDMLKIALSGAMAQNSKLDVSDYEIQKSGASYTYLTLQHFHSLGCRDITFLCGGDMFSTLGVWRCPEVIFSLARIAYVARGRDGLDAITNGYRERFGARILPLEMERTPISSSEVRRALAEGRDVSRWLDSGVIKYIKEHHLYGS